MNLEELRQFCLALPAVTEDVKWEHDLCFSIGGKMFCVGSLEPPFTFSFKTDPEIFQQLVELPSVTPAPYLAKHHWVLVAEGHTLTKAQLEEHIARSYALIKSKLPKKFLKENGLAD